MREELVTKHGMNIYEIDLTSWREKAAEVHKDLEKSGFIPDICGKIKNVTIISNIDKNGLLIRLTKGYCQK